MARKLKFNDGGATALDRLASGEEAGRFDQDVYARAKKFLEQSKQEETPKPTKPRAAAKPAAKPTPKAKPKEMSSKGAQSSGSGEIPVDNRYSAPESTGRMPGETERNIRNALAATGGIGRLIGPAVAAKSAPPTSRALAELETTPIRFLGASGRRNITPAERLAMRRAEALEAPASRSRVALERGPKSLPPPERSLATRMRAEEFEPAMKKGGKVKGYSSGGKIRGGGCESKGKTRGKMV